MKWAPPGVFIIKIVSYHDEQALSVLRKIEHSYFSTRKSIYFSVNAAMSAGQIGQIVLVPLWSFAFSLH